MTASNEGRDAAIVELSKHYVNVEDPCRCVCGARVRSWHEHLVDALIAHGWGPRPKLDAEDIEDAAGCCGSDPVITLLRDHGIEVTE